MGAKLPKETTMSFFSTSDDIHRPSDSPSELQDPPDWQEILTYWRGSELQNYFTRILEDDLQAIIKPQYVDNIPKAVRCFAR